MSKILEVQCRISQQTLRRTTHCSGRAGQWRCIHYRSRRRWMVVSRPPLSVGR